MSNRSINPWCRVCLISNVRMCSIENIRLIEIYRKLTNTQPNKHHEIPRAICYICYSQVQRARRFSDMAHRSQKTLEDLYQRGVEPYKVEIMPNIDKALNLCMTDVLTTSVTETNNINAQISKSHSVFNEVTTEETNKTHEISLKSEPHNCINATETMSSDDVKKETICEVDIKMEVNSDDDTFSSITEECEKIEITIDPTQTVSTNEGGIFSTTMQPTAVPQLACHICNKVFNKNCTLLAHIRTHTGEKPYVCNFCNKAFSEKGSLRKHMKSHTGEKPHECNLCHRMFTRKYNLRCHLRIHSKEKLYECNWCHKTFTHAQTLQSHVRIHTGEKPFKCNMCDRTFTQRISLQSHLRTHTGEKPYICNTCNKAFAAKGNLQNHLRIHTGEKPHVCNICNRAFTEKSNLKSHIRIHTGEKL